MLLTNFLFYPSINIAGPDHENFHSVLFHFNPRHYERGGQLVLNNKQEGMWGQAINGKWIKFIVCIWSPTPIFY